MSYTIVDKNAKRQKMRKIKRKITLALTCLFVVIGYVAFSVYWKSMTPTIITIAQTKVQSETTRIINEAVCLSLNSCGNLDDFVQIQLNDKKEIVFVSSNTTLVNNLARNTALLSQQKLNDISKMVVRIPIGTLSGVPLLAEKGPTIDINVCPIGAVRCNFTSKFDTAGINQTLHRIYIEVQCQIDIILPTSHHVVENNTPILVSETVIVGNVPQSLLTGGLVLGNS